MHRGVCRRNPGLTDLAGQDVGLILPLFGLTDLAAQDVGLILPLFGLTDLAGQDVGLILPLFHCFGTCFMLLLHVLLLNKPAWFRC